MMNDTRTLVRPGDPETSREAAEGQVERLTEKQDMVLVVLQEHPNGLHDEALSEYCATKYGWSPYASTARSRRNELVEKGAVFATDRRSLTRTGQPCIVWAAEIMI